MKALHLLVEESWQGMKTEANLHYRSVTHLGAPFFILLAETFKCRSSQKETEKKRKK